jgi:hypothetical protein
MKLMDAELARLKLLEAAQSNAGHLDKVAEEADKGIAQAAEFQRGFGPTSRQTTPAPKMSQRRLVGRPTSRLDPRPNSGPNGAERCSRRCLKWRLVHPRNPSIRGPKRPLTDRLVSIRIPVLGAWEADALPAELRPRRQGF